MIYRKLLACLAAVCLAAGSLVPTSLADQTDAVQVAAETQSGSPEAVKETPAPDTVSEPVQVSEEEIAEPEPEKASVEETTEPEPEKASVEETTEPEPEKAPVEETAESEPEKTPSADVPQEDHGEENPSDTATMEPEQTPGPSVEPEGGEGSPAPDEESEDTGSDQTPGGDTMPGAGEVTDAEAENVPDNEDTERPASQEPSGAEQALGLSVRADCLYAFAGSDTVKFRVSVTGGKAPYEVSFTAKGSADQKKTVTLDEGNECSFKCAPEEFGTLKIAVKVTDAGGSTAVEKINIPVPVRVKEDPEDWEKDLEDMQLTGDWRKDLIAVALTQLGYEESSRNYIIEADGKKRGYTRYGDWYAGSSDYHDWCAMFVCFCMHYADIPEADYPRDNISHQWKKYIESADAFEAAEDYAPRSGDLIFFNKDEDSRMDHIGIVEFADDEYVHTIEGNSGKKVARKSYKLDDETIAGYANTAYLMDKAGIEPEKAESRTARNVRRSYEGFTAGTMVNIRAEASAESTWIACIPEEGTEVKVRKVEFTDDQMWYKIEYEDHEGYILGDLLKVDGYAELIYAAADGKTE